MEVVVAGEDEELKRVMWVVENLQEDLLAADNARMAADEKVQARSIIVQDLQVALMVPLSSSPAFAHRWCHEQRIGMSGRAMRKLPL
jgi:hypothetical protein